MKAWDYLRKYYIIAFALVLFFLAFIINQNLYRPNVVLSKQDETWNLNNEMILKFNLGFKRLVSSFLWISTVLESDIDHYKNKDLNSWMFLRFNTISVLEPKFYENYALGGPYLSIVKDDLTGASIIYDKGLKLFPDDFYLLRDAGFHYHFEMGDYSKSFEIYSKLRHHKQANPVIISNLARLETERGNLAVAFDLLLDQLNSIQDKESFLAKKVRSHLYSVKAEIDLNCLNKKLKNCSEKDFYGNNYLIKNTIYFAAHEWQLYRIQQHKQ